MQTTKFRTVGIALILVAGTALSGCSALGGILDQVAGGGSANDSSAFAIKVGDCFSEPDLAADEFVSDVEFVECAVPHDNEAYASVLMKEVDFPGDEAAATAGQDACITRFVDFLGTTEDYDGTLRYAFFYPSQESWDGGDREILCYVYDDEGDTVGSLKGAAS